MHPCPICAEPAGFHGLEPHATARTAIPPELTWKPGETPPYRRTEDERRHKLIGEWHNLPPDHPGAKMLLHEYMGLTWAQYRAWIEGRRS